MAKLLIVVDSAAQAAFMKDYYGDRADCVVCSWPLFRTSHQAASGAPAGILFHFDGMPAGQECLTALHAYRDKEIILALEATAQANYLCWQISGYLSQIGGRPAAVKRLSPTAFSKDYIETALSVAGPVDKRQGPAFYGRLLFDDCLARHLVRLVGTDRGPGNLLLRHNSLATLFLLTEREQECQMFPLAQKWQIQATLASGNTKFTTSLAKGLDLAADGLLGNEAKARSLRDQFGRTPFVVDAINRSPVVINAPEPYLLAELLHDAIVLLGLDPSAAMAIIQKLFHGVMVNGRPQGLVTSSSPETKCPSPETISALREQVVGLYGESALANYAAPAFGIIIPVKPELSGADLSNVLSQDETALYDLIRNRALASQMQAAVGDTITIDFLAGKEHIFQSHFHELRESGFLQNTAIKMNGVLTPCPLPGIQGGQRFQPAMVECQATTAGDQTAERYTIETLLAALADFSIAADPVTIAMADELLKAGYATISPQGTLEAGDNTAKVVTILNRAFPRMQGLNLSAYVEQTIAEAASSRKDLLFALKQFDQTLLLHGTVLVKSKIPSKVQPRARTSSTIIKQASTPLESAEVLKEERGPVPIADAVVPPAETPTTTELGATPPEQPEPSLEPASPEPLRTETALPEKEVAPVENIDTGSAPEMPVDDTPLVTPWPDDLQKAFAEALSGATTAPEAASTAETLPSRTPDGTATAAAPSAEGRRCPVCQKPLILKEDQFGPFWGCSGFPGCRYSEATSQNDQPLNCPLCNQGLNRKQTPTGKSFYVCENQECQFMSWSKPHYLSCGLCDSPYLVEKTVRGLTQLRCPRAGCPYGQPLPEDNQGDTAPLPSLPKTKKVLVRRVAAGTTTGGATKKMVRVVRRRT